MSKYSKLAKNTGIFFVANFGSKILTFLLVRFYTEFLSTEEFGIVDLLNTTASLAFPIVTLCITEAVLRFSIDDTDNRGKILTNGLMVAMIGNLAFVLTAPVFLQIDTFADNVLWIYLLTLSNSLFTIITHFCRGIGKSKLFAASGLLHTIFQISFNVLFLMVFSWGIKGYLFASILANLITCTIVFLYGRLHTFILWQLDRAYLKIMLIYAIPMIPNSIFWWMMQSANRYIIIYTLSAAENGLYAVANKIPTVITTVSGIFFQAWQISSIEEANSKSKSQFYSRIFEGLSVLLITMTSAIMVILQPMYKILTEESYHIGWTCTPFLLCAMVYSCYSSFLGTNYIAMKKTKGIFLTTGIGAVANVVLNIVFISFMGIEGTALATLVAFFLTWVSRIFGTRNFVRIKYPIITFWLPSAMIVIQASLLTFGIESMLIQAVFFAIILVLYSKTIIGYMKLSVGLLTKLKKR